VADKAELERLLGVALTDAEAQALLQSYQTLASLAAQFTDLRDTEPPLRSIAGPPTRG
jgi:hypothetical protein